MMRSSARPEFPLHALRLAAALLVAVAASFPITALAAVRYASPSGTSSNSGSSATSPWSMSKANSSLVAGDVCYLLPGTYTTSISPANSGTPFERITYLGDLDDPSRAHVPSIAVNESWITVKGVQADNGTDLDYPARFDSIAFCTMRALNLSAAKNSMVAHNRINGSVYYAANDGRACFSGQNLDAGCFANSEYDTLRNNDINLGTLGPGARRFDVRGFTKECLFDSNRVVGVFDNGSSTDPDAGVAFICYNSHANTFRDNRWVLEALSRHNSSSQIWGAFAFRDSITDFLFERDTMLLALNSNFEVRGMLSASGSFPGSVARNHWKNCHVKINGYILAQDRFENSIIENSLFASKGGNIITFNKFNGSVLKRNTFYGAKQTLNFDVISGSGNEITSNIFYSANAGALGNSGGVVFFNTNARSGFRSDNNLFFSPSFTSRPGDRSLVWCCYDGSLPGPGTAWNRLNGNDASSKYGSPWFVDSAFATLDVRLRPQSLAIGVGEGGVDAGAIPFAGGGTDITPPGAVADLRSIQVGDQTLLLAWTAPGDDGAIGVAAGYDLRWSLSPITEANFGAATALTPAPVPLPGGSQQSYLVVSLTPSTRYYLAIRARDRAGNVAALGNVLESTTLATDGIAPAAIQDLSSTP